MAAVNSTINQRYQAEREFLARDFRNEYNQMIGGGVSRPKASNPLIHEGEDPVQRRTGRKRLGGVEGGASASAPFATAGNGGAQTERMASESSRYGLFSKQSRNSDYGQRELDLVQAAQRVYAAAPAGPPQRAAAPKDALDIFSDEMATKLKPQGRRRQQWQAAPSTKHAAPWGEW